MCRCIHMVYRTLAKVVERRPDHLNLIRQHHSFTYNIHHVLYTVYTCTCMCINYIVYIYCTCFLVFSMVSCACVSN